MCIFYTKDDNDDDELQSSKGGRAMLFAKVWDEPWPCVIGCRVTAVDSSSTPNY
jgi:hypothetical protein